MIKNIFFIGFIYVFLMTSSTFATPVKITIESYTPATLPTASIIIDVTDMSDQLEISRQAALFALSSQGWNLQSLGGTLGYASPPEWSDWVYGVDIMDPTNYMGYIFGYDLNAEAMQYGPGRGLVFHTDRWVERLLHKNGESPNNYGVISGAMGGIWAQCPVQNWGSFSVENVNFVPEPTTILLLFSGLIGLAGIRRKLKN